MSYLRFTVFALIPLAAAFFAKAGEEESAFKEWLYPVVSLALSAAVLAINYYCGVSVLRLVVGLEVLATQALLFVAITIWRIVRKTRIY